MPCLTFIWHCKMQHKTSDHDVVVCFPVSVHFLPVFPVCRDLHPLIHWRAQQHTSIDGDKNLPPNFDLKTNGKAHGVSYVVTGAWAQGGICPCLHWNGMAHVMALAEMSVTQSQWLCKRPVFLSFVAPLQLFTKPTDSHNISTFQGKKDGVEKQL